MYQITCDGYPLYDPRDDELLLGGPKVTLEVNTVGSGSFTIYQNHPYYDKLKKLKSVFEVTDDIGVIFRGRMIADSVDFDNSKTVDLEGAMAYFNDSIVRPYSFPEDFTSDPEYITAAESGNVIAFFLGWLISQHNEQVDDFQRFKLGRVTVSDPNNYLSRSDTNYPNTWEVLKSKLFDSALGGYLCIRYEADGNYIDYLSEFDLYNPQEIVYGSNLLDIKTEGDATTTYSAIVPIGATEETEIIDEDGNTISIKTTLTVRGLPDGDITDDLVKEGDVIYSRKARAAYGLVIAPVSQTTWDDVTEAENLQTKGANYLSTDGIMLTDGAELTAVDLHFSDEQIQTFRMYRLVNTRSEPHGHTGTYLLAKLGLALVNPQNTKITVGSTQRTFTDINSEKESTTTNRIESAEKDIEENRSNIVSTTNQLVIQSTKILNSCNEIILSALEAYVETSDYDTFKETVEAQLQILADEITLRFTETTEHIENVNGDIQRQLNTITKYFTFDIDGLTVGEVDSPARITIDNDDITIYANDTVVQKFKADGSSLIPILNVTNNFNLLGYETSLDEAKNLNCDFTGVRVTILKQPKSASLMHGETTTLSVLANDDGAYIYIWENSPDGETWTAGASGPSNSIVVSEGDQAVIYYRCLVIDADNTSNAEYSDTARIEWS